MTIRKNLKLWTINLVSFVLFLLLSITGLINWLVLPHGGGRQEGILIGIRHLLKDVHAWLAVLFIVAITIHLVLHWSYIKANLNKSGLSKKNREDRHDSKIRSF